MTIERTVEIHADHCLVMELPPEIPVGRARVEVTVTPKPLSEEEAALRRQRQQEALDKCRSLARGVLSSDEFLEMRRKDRELEDEQDARRFRESLTNMCLNRATFENPSTEPLEPLLGMAEGSAFTVERLLKDRRDEERRDSWTIPLTPAP